MPALVLTLSEHFPLLQLVFCTGWLPHFEHSALGLAVNVTKHR